MVPPASTLSEYLHGELRGLATPPTLPRNAAIGAAAIGAAAAAGSEGRGVKEEDAPPVLGPTVAERVEVCDRYARYATSLDGVGLGLGLGVVGGLGGAATPPPSPPPPGHGTVDGYVDLCPLPASSSGGDKDGGKGNANGNGNGNGNGDAATTRPAAVLLPPLDWSRTFRKGYSVQMWVRPVPAAAAAAAAAPEEEEAGAMEEGDRPPDDRPRILYRLGTHRSNEEGAGVCATLGRWTAVRDGSSGSGNGKEAEAEVTHVTASLTVHTLPHHKSNPVLFIPSGSGKKGRSTSAGGGTGAGAGAGGRPGGAGGESTTGPSFRNPLGASFSRSFEDDDLAQEGWDGTATAGPMDPDGSPRKRLYANGAPAVVPSALPAQVSPTSEGEAAKAAAEEGQAAKAAAKQKNGGAAGGPGGRRRGLRRGSSSSSSSWRDSYGGGGGSSLAGGLPGLPESVPSEASLLPVDRTQAARGGAHPLGDAASLATATLTLPVGRWCLIGISHVQPYLKRPQISVCVNGDEVLRGELGYPTVWLDGAAAKEAPVSPSRRGLSARAPAQGDALRSVSSPSLGFRAGGSGGMTAALGIGAGNRRGAAGGDDGDEDVTYPPGWMGHCTLLDNVFGRDGVDVVDVADVVAGAAAGAASASSPPARSVPFHMHLASVGVYPEPISSTVQAIVADFGPNVPPGMLVPPVPCVVQNRDSVVTDGEAPGGGGGPSDEFAGGGGGGGGSGSHHHTGIAVGRGAKSGRAIGQPTSVGVLVPADRRGRSSLRLSITGGGELSLQKAMGRAVWGWSMSDAQVQGGGGSGAGRIQCAPSRYNSTIGDADDVPKVGLVKPQPTDKTRSPHGLLGDRGGVLGLGLLGGQAAGGALYEEFPGADNRRYDDGGTLRFAGSCRLWSAAEQYVAAERARVAALPRGSAAIAAPPERMPSLSSSSYHLLFTAADPVSYLLLPLHLALPPAGHQHNLQKRLYRESFWHLEALLTDPDGRGEGGLLAAIIRTIAASLRLGGRFKDEFLQSGSVYVLANLIRRVLLRGTKLGLISPPAGSGASAVDGGASPTKGRDLTSDRTIIIDYDDSVEGVKHGLCRPPTLPPLVADALVALIDACCGSLMPDDANLGGDVRTTSGPGGSNPANRRSTSGGQAGRFFIPSALHVARTSDLAQSVLFGLALDFDLYSGDVMASAKILDAIVRRYCVGTSGEEGTRGKAGYGWLFRNHVSVQTFLDSIRISFGELSLTNTTHEHSSAILSAANSLSTILKKMLYYSLSTQRLASRGEHDVSACASALTESQLGSFAAHVVLTALVEFLVETGAMLDPFRAQEKGQFPRLELTSRLGRNLLMSQFHDVVAPMLLGRTVFSGQKGYNTADAISRKGSDGWATEASSLDWNHDWRMTLLVFSWLTSIAGPEGAVTAKSTASLVEISGRAGSLSSCLLSATSLYVESLVFPVLPPPRPAQGRDVSEEARSILMENYMKDLSHRLRVVLHLLPGLIASLTTKAFDEDAKTDSGALDDRATKPICELLGAVSKSFKQIGLDSESSKISVKGKDSQRSKSAGIMAIKAAKEALPPMLEVCALLGDPISCLVDTTQQDLSTRKARDKAAATTSSQEGNEEGSTSSDWVDVPQCDSSKEGASSKSVNESIDVPLQRLSFCHRELLNTAAGLVLDGMLIGASESRVVWNIVIASLEPWCRSSRGENDLNKDNDPRGLNDGHSDDAKSAEGPTGPMGRGIGHDILCRLASIVLIKIVEGNASDEEEGSVWSSVDFCGGTARLCDLCEEKGLLKEMSGAGGEKEAYTADQARLLCAILQLMASARMSLGWSQKDIPDYDHGHLPESESTDSSASTSTKDRLRNRLAKYVDESNSASRGYDEYHQLTDWTEDRENISSPLVLDHSNASKLLLPILHPCLRTVLQSISALQSVDSVIVQPSKGGDPKPLRLLPETLAELEKTLNAAITGLRFPTARDVALHALSSLRTALGHYESVKDDDAMLMCRSLVVAVSEEMRQRYVERREANNELETDNDEGNDEGEEILSAVERMMIGDTLMPSAASNGTGESKTSEEFITSRSDAGEGATAKLKWIDYEGFGSELDRCGREALTEAAGKNEHRADVCLEMLKVFLDRYDQNQANDEMEAEIVELFDGNTDLIEGFSEGVRERSGKSLASSETAADAIVQFAEISSRESSRLIEIKLVVASQRSKHMAFANRSFHRSWLELFHDDHSWERSIADGGRGYGSRVCTVPIAPQFKRHIPPWLDHTLTNDSLSPEEVAEEAGEAKEESGFETFGMDEIAEATKALEGKVKIVDITKQKAKELKPEDEGDMESGSDDITSDSIEGDDGSLGFPDKHRHEVNGDGNEPETEDIGVAAQELSEVPTLSETSNGDIKRHGSGERLFVEAPSDGALDQSQVMEGQDNERRRPFHVSASSFASPPDGQCILGHIYGSDNMSEVIEHFYANCFHVQQAGTRKCQLLITSSHLILEYDEAGLFEEEAGHLKETRKRHLEDDDVAATTTPTPQLQTDQNHTESHTESSNPLLHSVKQEEDSPHAEKAVAFERLERQHLSSGLMRPKMMRWNISELSHIYLRRYRLRDTALELFLIPTAGELFGSIGLYSSMNSIFVDFGPGYQGTVKRDDAANAIMRRAPAQTIKQWPDRSGQFLHEQLRNVTRAWISNRLSNFDYLMSLNILAGRSFNDLCQYPVFPWVLGGDSYKTETLPDLGDSSSFRDLSKPMGALNPQRLHDFKTRFESFQEAGVEIPPFMYGSHYSTCAGVVCYFLLRLHPFSQLHRQLQSGHFDVADRLFSSVPRTWEMNTGPSAAEVKELTPEWYCNPAFLRNANNYKLGVTQDGEKVGDVVLPPWAKGSPEKFVEVMRMALESDICSEMLPNWIDLIFGRKQQGPAAIEANNVFFYLTYYGSVDVAAIEDEDLRQSTEDQISHFGQCPMQLFWRPHVQRLHKNSVRVRSFDRYIMNETALKGKMESLQYESQAVMASQSSDNGEESTNAKMPLLSAPLSHWVNISAPPPGPHAPLIALRLAGSDRILAVDSIGVFHSFRWVWRAESITPVHSSEEDHEPDGEAKEKLVLLSNADLFADKGVFVAQRDLPSFRTIPRLPYAPPDASNAKLFKRGVNLNTSAVVAISKTMFASRTLLLVVSDGDGSGGLCLQLVTAGGTPKTETIIPQVHSERITAIALDPIGNAAGHGGVGGELAIIGSADGTASLWRFISSQFLPLRPRLRLGGHSGLAIQSVYACGELNLCASVSRDRACVFSTSNGALVRSFRPPTRDGKNLIFADCPAMCLSPQGYIAVVCEEKSQDGSDASSTKSLELFTCEGHHLGSNILPHFRGTPHKMVPISDGNAVMICSSRGITVHRLSALRPLEIIDDWCIGLRDPEAYGVGDIIPTAYDVDFGPSPNKPIVAATACSAGALQLHALRGISQWSEEHKQGAVSAAMGNALARPAARLRNIAGGVKNIGSRFMGVGKEVASEALDEVKEQAGSRGLFGLRRKR